MTMIMSLLHNLNASFHETINILRKIISVFKEHKTFVRKWLCQSTKPAGDEDYKCCLNAVTQCDSLAWPNSQCQHAMYDVQCCFTDFTYILGYVLTRFGSLVWLHNHFVFISVIWPQFCHACNIYFLSDN